MEWALLVLLTVAPWGAASSKLSRDNIGPSNQNEFGEGLMEVYYENLYAAEVEDRRHPDFPPDPHSLPRENMKHILAELSSSGEADLHSLPRENLKHILAELSSSGEADLRSLPRENLKNILEERAAFGEHTTVADHMRGKSAPGSFKGQSSARRFKRDIVPSDERYEDGVVPYVITDTLDDVEKSEIKRAMLLYEQFTCIRFVKYDEWRTKYTWEYSQKGSLKFVNHLNSHGGCCWVQYLGDQGRENEVYCGKGSVCVHELGHALGLPHEQSSSDPNRKWMMRVNGDQGEQWRSYEGAESLVGYDLTSFMHYANYGNQYTLLYPEAKDGYNKKRRHFIDGKPEFYYPLKEVSLAYKCAERLCPYFKMTCENDGYLTQVRGRCTCVCVPGLDPDTGCRTTISSTTKTIEFPGGSFALPKPETGCNIPSSKSGYVRLESGKHSLSEVRGDSAAVSYKHDFCVAENSENRETWPEGNYCIYRKGGICPAGFDEGFIEFEKGETCSDDESFVEGALPDIIITNTITIEYCCRSDGFTWEPLVFPNRNAFNLLKNKKGYHWGDDKQCPTVQGMHVYQRLYEFKNIEAQGGFNPLLEVYSLTFKYSDIHKKLQYELTSCQYKPAFIDCGAAYVLSEDNPTVSFSSKPGSELECNWYITTANDAQVKLNFNSFNISGQPGDCKDELEVRYFRPGQDGVAHCGDRMDKTIQSVYSTIVLRLSTFGSTSSSFSATASIISNDELCYNSGDRGTSYDGNVNFTRDFEPCLPWSETSHCMYNLFSNPGYTDAVAPLEGNSCRNPDFSTGFVPWCYTKAYKCERNYCDSCLFGNTFDKDRRCQEKEEEEDFCAVHKHEPESLLQCAKTCKVNTPTVKHISNTVCPMPDNVCDGVVVSSNPHQVYSVGSKVTYKCRDSIVTKDRVCLSSGKWSPMGFVCDVCSDGWSFDLPNNRCLKLLNTTEQCVSYGGSLATAKGAHENAFLKDMSDGHDIWLPLTDAEVEDKWVWDDGEEAIFTNWDLDEPDNLQSMAGYDQDCAVMRGYNGMWNDVGCSERFMYPSVCSTPKFDPPLCVDFLDTCSSLFESDIDMCAKHPEFAVRSCPFTCGKCDTGSMPRCTVQEIPNGKPSTNEVSVKIGTVVTYTCNEGYVAISGAGKTGCSSTGSMLGETLRCMQARTDC